jgi:putative membrane protein
MMWGGGMIFGWLFWLAILAGVVWLVVRLADSSRRNPGRQDNEPMRILKERFARGEINREEYDERRKTLANS